MFRFESDCGACRWILRLSGSAGGQQLLEGCAPISIWGFVRGGGTAIVYYAAGEREREGVRSVFTTAMWFNFSFRCEMRKCQAEHEQPKANHPRLLAGFTRISCSALYLWIDLVFFRFSCALVVSSEEHITWILSEILLKSKCILFNFSSRIKWGFSRFSG